MSPVEPAAARPTLGKRVFFVAAMLAITVGLVEVTVWAIFRPVVPGADQIRELEVATEDAAAGIDSLDVRRGREKAGLGFRDPSMTLHPYLGYVFLPKKHRSPDNPGHAAIAISDDGFLDPDPAVRERRDDRLLVGITGGSVAGQLGTWHSKHMEAALRRRPELQGRDPEFVWLGMPGYHQPQQAIQLLYVLAQGGEFDVFINLDGFNELAVPGVLNAPQGAHPLFPMNWSMVALDVPDPELRRTLGAIDHLRAERRARNTTFARSSWRRSPTVRLLRQLDDDKRARQLAQYAWELQQFEPDEVPYFVSGPERMHGPTDTMLPELVGVWKRASLQMHAVCSAAGIRYLHLLQPNQYDPGSKPLSAEETEKAFEDGGPYQAVIVSGYPLLRAAGQELRAAGVAFHDLSRIFENNKQTLYTDNCCHFNSEGNQIMADAIAAAVADAL